MSYTQEQLYEVCLKSGQKIICTDEHKFLTRRGWVELRHLSKSDAFVVAHDRAKAGDVTTTTKLRYVRKHSRRTYWDVHVFGVHNYLSNGIVNHNSGKSHFFAEQLIQKCLTHPGTDWVCLREVQMTLTQSVKKLLEAKIRKFGVGAQFDIQHNLIKTPGDGVIIFQGMQDHTAESIKSLEGFDGAWFEESQTMSEKSLELLRPTLRKDHSELWFSWNPLQSTDPIDQLLRGPEPPTGSIVVQANYTDNPWFPQVLEEERLFDFKHVPNRYGHIWLGEYGRTGDAFFPIEYFLVDGQPVDVTWRTDQIFAVMDTASKDGAQHDGTGVIYYARSKYAGIPLVILDWDVVQIQASLLSDFIPSINRRLEELAAQTKAREGNVGLWIEDKDAGISLNQSLPRQGIAAHPIDGKLTASGKEGRAIVASPYIYKGKVKIARHAFDKTSIYRGQSKNHFVDQVGGFCIGMKRTEHKLDLVDCTTYGVCIGLGDSSGY